MTKVNVKECCDKWWESLSDKEKMWIHYYFHDMKKRKDRLKDILVEEMHESRFTMEGRSRT